jgi:hypothetical protein
MPAAAQRKRASRAAAAVNVLQGHPEQVVAIQPRPASDSRSSASTARPLDTGESYLRVSALDPCTMIPGQLSGCAVSCD